MLFQITIFNKSDGKSSFKAELEMEYLRGDDSVARVVLTHNEQHKVEIPQKEIPVFPDDIRIEEKGMQSKWLIFEEPVQVFAEYRIEKYTVKVIDTQGNQETAESAIIKDMSHVEEHSN